MLKFNDNVTVNINVN